VTIIRDVLADLKKIDQNPKVMRLFGFLMAGLFLIFSIIIWFKHRHESPPFTTSGYVFVILAVLAFLIAIVSPKLLKPLNTCMVFVAMIIGWFMTRFILFSLFYLVFFPIGLMLRLTKHDAMRKKMLPDQPSYWQKRPDEAYDPARSKRLF